MTVKFDFLFCMGIKRLLWSRIIRSKLAFLHHLLSRNSGTIIIALLSYSGCLNEKFTWNEQKYVHVYDCDDLWTNAVKLLRNFSTVQQDNMHVHQNNIFLTSSWNFQGKLWNVSWEIVFEDVDDFEED